MKKVFPILSIAVFLCVLTANSFSQTKGRRPAPVPAKVQPASIYGEVEKNVYTNRFFEFKLTVPETWLIQEQEVSDAIKKQGGSMVKGKSTAMDKAFRNAEKRLTMLLTFSKDILGIQNNAIATVGAERAMPTMPFRSGEDYLRLNLQTMRSLQLPADFKFSNTVETDELGTTTFPYVQINRNGYDQRIYSITKKGYALIFTFSYTSEDDLNILRDVLKNADLSWKAPLPPKK